MLIRPNITGVTQAMFVGAWLSYLFVLAVYGFGKEAAGSLLRLARREGLKGDDGSGVGYANPIGSLILFVGKTDAAINKNAAGTVSRYFSTAAVTSSASLTDTTDNDTVCNIFANVGSGKFCIYVAVGPTLFMIAAEC